MNLQLLHQFYMHIQSPNFYLDIPQSLPAYHSINIVHFQLVKKERVEGVKVIFDGCSLHDQILGYPHPVLFTYHLSQLLTLKIGQK